MEDHARSSESTSSRRAEGALARRDVLLGAAAVGVAAAARGGERQRPGVEGAKMDPIEASRTPGLLYPQQNQHRQLFDLSGIWHFQPDPEEVGEAAGWFASLPSPRLIAVPCSWNDLFDDARNYLGLAWYVCESFIPSTWRSERVFLRVGSANYAAKAWVNCQLVVRHDGGHLPFEADVTNSLAWDRPNSFCGKAGRIRLRLISHTKAG